MPATAIELGHGNMEKSVKEISVAIFWGGFCPLWGENKVNDNYIQCNINRVNIILIFQLYIYIYMPYLDGSDIINKLVLWYTPDIYSRMRPIKTIWCRIFWKGWKAAIGFLKWRCLIKKKRGGGRERDSWSADWALWAHGHHRLGL